MKRYLLRRLLYFVPTLVLVSLITFGLSRLAPGDPVESIIGISVFDEETNPDDEKLRLEEYARAAAEYHYDCPPFYFAIIPQNYPDTLYKIQPLSNRKHVTRLLRKYDDWSKIVSFTQEIAKMRTALLQIPQKPANYSATIERVNRLSLAIDNTTISALLSSLKKDQDAYPKALANIDKIDALFQQMQQTHRLRMLIPKWVWYGFDNQYHHWVSGVLRGNFGLSVIDKKPVMTKIWATLPNTLWLNLTTLVVGLIFGILSGILMAIHPQKWYSKLARTKMYAWLAIPSFWLASLLVIFFTTNDYGAWTNLFPSNGLGHFPQGATLFQRVFIRMSHLFLPVMSLAIPLIATLALQMRRSLAAEMKKPYIKTAILKGIPLRQVIWRHGVKNAIFPIVTLFGNILPALIGGSVAIELIFNIPGMGHLLLQSIYGKDWPVVFAVLVITAILTILSLLLTDILYTKLDPRVRLNHQKSRHE